MAKGYLLARDVPYADVFRLQHHRFDAYEKAKSLGIEISADECRVSHSFFEARAAGAGNH
ncbi:hypothetical protein [Bradyrhizobium sp. Gha]|uniref:hypothetical protein n=1 Tax=Bradyrhizobium sp. Gha TaxID=1855318 RepID=UPI0008E84042|nr:hypothetical protein [Bradyrhizobium sp. Gha]SFI10239.1 hypothetical protein SAMN05216525_104119 [Bradyrhizobium sp. Gha]